MKFLKNIIRTFVFRTGRLKSFYLKLCSPGGAEWARFLRLHGQFYSIGDNCRIWPYTNIPNPQYVKIGNNVMLTACSIFGHDGVVGMLDRAYDKKLDSVGKVVINDNVFIGHGSIIMPNVEIGPNAVVAAGSVVTKDVPEGAIVAGVPSRTIGSTDELVSKLESKTKRLPWYDLIKKRKTAFDPLLELKLIQQRTKYFFENSE